MAGWLSNATPIKDFYTPSLPVVSWCIMNKNNGIFAAFLSITLQIVWILYWAINFCKLRDDHMQGNN